MGELFKWINIKYIYGIMAAAAVILAVKYILPLVLPFLIAVCIVVPMAPFLKYMEKKLHISRSVLAGGILILAGALLSVGVWYLVSWFCTQVGVWIQNGDIFQDCFCRFIRNCSQAAEARFGLDASELEKILLQRTDIFMENVQVEIVPKLMHSSLSYAKTLLTVGAFFVVTLISTILLAKDFESIRSRLEVCRGFRTLEEVCGEIGRMIFGYAKAQGIILIVISLICISGLFLAGIENWVMTGILAGILDALPFIGTGIVLMPVALWQLLQGNLLRAFLCLLIYAACALSREFLEPKLIGKKMGIYPVVILLAIYAGVKFYGLSGVVTGPFSFLVIREIYKKLPDIKGKDQSDG